MFHENTEKQSNSCLYFVKWLSARDEIKGSLYFPIILLQNNYSGPKFLRINIMRGAGYWYR